MIPNLMSIINSEKFKSIPGDIKDVKEFIEKVIPQGYSEKLVPSTDNIDVYIDVVMDEGVENQIKVPSNLYDLEGNTFPKFYLTDMKSLKIELNQNQLLHLVLIENFEKFKTMSTVYLSILGKAFKQIMRFTQYKKPSNFNDKVKMDNLKVVIPFKDLNTLSNNFSSIVFGNSVTEQQWKAIFKTLPVSPSSLGSMTKTNAVVFGDNVKYRAPAYSTDKKGFTSIFPVGPNIPARLQSHLLGESYELLEPSQSIIQQDNLIVDGKLVPKDKSLLESIVVFHPVDQDTCRFMAGEIEIDESVAETRVIVFKNVENHFETLNVKEGQSHYPAGKPFVLGHHLLDGDVTLYDYDEIHVTRIKITSISGAKKIYFKGVKKAGNARIINSTGIKGVTKVRTNLGSIVFNSQVTNDKSVSDDVLQVLQKRYPGKNLESLTDFKPIVETSSLTIKPNLVLGMNSAKAKSNTIVLAGACLAVKLGFYTPKPKHGFEGLLNSLDEQEINKAYKSLPEFKYIDNFGIEHKVHIGLAYITFTELGSTYTKVKNIPFSFESGKFLNKDSNPVANKLYDYIWDNYLEQDKIDASKELYSIYSMHQTQVFANPEKLPVYSIQEINELFKAKDLVLSKRVEFPSDTKLLDENWNKGFFIDLTMYENAPIIKIPSAKTLKLYSGVLKNGSTIYHTNLINVSKIIKGCMRKDEGGYALNTVYSKTGRWTPALAYCNYIDMIKATLYSSPDESQTLVQTFIKPQIPGCNLKQVLESYLPPSTVVVTDNRIYNKLRAKSLEGCPEGLQTELDAKLLYLTGELLNKDSKLNKAQLIEMFENINKSNPKVMAVRSPSLWSSQTLAARLWDLDTFRLYLKIYKNLDLEQVIDPARNRDVLLTSTDILVASHGDSDGDK